MKALFGKCVAFLVLFALPALADHVSTTVSFTNQGSVSGDLATGPVQSKVDTVSSSEGVIGPGNVGILTMKTGPITGSVSTGGTFSSGSFFLGSKDATVVGGSLKGTWSKLSNGSYQLVGQFSGSRGGVNFTGVTTQQFAYTKGHYVVVSGTTTIDVTR